MASYYRSSDGELVRYSRCNQRVPYPTPVPEDPRGSVDLNFVDDVAFLFEGHGEVSKPFATTECSLQPSSQVHAFGGFNNQDTVSHASSETSTLPPALSPDYEVLQSPSAAMNMLYDGICSPLSASDSITMYQQAGIVDPPLHSPTVHHHCDPEYINPADISPIPAYRFPSQLISYDSLNPEQSHPRMTMEPPGQSMIPIARSPPGAPITCHECNCSFDSKEKLSEHMQSDACKLYACLFSFAGCTTKCRSKNEWKRHINSIHVQYERYICNCTQAKCVEYRILSAPDGQPLPPTFPSSGKMFNRKDLYTEHRGREEDKRLTRHSDGTKKKYPRALLEKEAEKALHRRIELPEYMRCFVDGCRLEYQGKMAWTDYLDHMSDHVKDASGPDAEPISPSSIGDATLTNFGLSAGFLAKAESGWRLVEPLRGIKPGSKNSFDVSKAQKPLSTRGRRGRR